MTSVTEEHGQGQGVAGCACLRLRGLPFSATPADVIGFFSSFNVVDVLLPRSHGKHGEAVGVAGPRCTVARSPHRPDLPAESPAAVGVAAAWRNRTPVSEVLTPQHAKPATLVTAAPHRAAGRSNGQAYVLLHEDEAQRALSELHLQHMGKRYIE